LQQHYFFISGEMGKNVAYKTEKISRGEIKSVVTATGTVNAVTTVSVGTQVSGTIKKLFVDYNSPVKKNQLLAQIDPATFQAQVDQARANLLSAKANLEKPLSVLLMPDELTNATKNYSLRISSPEVNWIRQKQLCFPPEAQLKVNQAQVEQAKASLKIAETNLQYTNIVSP